MNTGICSICGEEAVIHCVDEKRGQQTCERCFTSDVNLAMLCGEIRFERLKKGEEEA